MTKEEMIAKLQDPKEARPYWWYLQYLPGAARILDNAGMDNILRCTQQSIAGVPTALTPKRNVNDCFLLKPDYELPEEVEEWEVFAAKNKELLCQKPNGYFKSFGFCVNSSQFRGCFCEDGEVLPYLVARFNAKGKKVTVKMVKE